MGLGFHSMYYEQYMCIMNAINVFLLCVSSQLVPSSRTMRIAVIGQSLFGKEVYKELVKEGHQVVGVFTIPDKDGKSDLLGRRLNGSVGSHG